MISTYIIENLKEKGWSSDDDINFTKNTRISTGLTINGVKQLKEVTLKLELLEGECNDVVISGYSLQDIDNEYINDCEFFCDDEDLIKNIDNL